MIRVARPDDAAALARMLARCSPHTLYQRFHGVVTEIPPAYLRRCLGGEHLALVSEVDGEIAGLASIGPVFEEPDVAEMAVIIEDAWQGRGSGARSWRRWSRRRASPRCGWRCAGPRCSPI